MLFAVIAGVMFFAFRTPPSCFDKVQNQDELGVDCGGSCSAVCQSEVIPLVKRWQRFFKMGEGRYDVVAWIDNPNINFGISKFKYRLALYDEKNVFIAERLGEVFLNPNEEKVIFEAEVETGNRVPKKAFLTEYKPEEQVWERITPDPKRPVLRVGNKNLKEGASPKISADIINDSPRDAEGVNVVVVAYDESGNAIAASATNIDVISKNSTEIAFFSWPASFGAKVANYDIFPRVNLTSSGAKK